MFAGFLLGLLSSVVAAVLLLTTFRVLLRPRVSICPTVAKAWISGKPYLVFKLVNRSPRQVIGIRIQLHREKDGTDVPGGSRALKKIPLLTESMFCLEQYDPYENRNDYYFRLRTRIKNGYENIHDVFEDGDNVRLRLRIIMRDPISQVEVVETHFFEEDQAVDGNFLPGRNCRVVEDVELDNVQKKREWE